MNRLFSQVSYRPLASQLHSNKLLGSPLFRTQQFAFNNRSLTTQISNTYFQQFLPKYDCRKVILRENKTLNDDFRKSSLSRIERIVEKAKDNKLKLIFFIAVFLICQYTSAYSKLVFWWKFKEPIKRKLMRWVFGAQNTVPSTIVEQRFHDIKIPQETKDILMIQFRMKEKGLELGITRKYMYQVYRDLELFPKEEDKDFFYRASGYGKKRNQKPAGINMREFLKLYQEGLEKKQKKDKSYTEEEYKKQFLTSIESHYSKMASWEQKFLKKRADFRKMNMEKEKKAIIREILDAQPLISMEDLDAKLKNHGLFGASTKEKILALNSQLVLLKLYQNYYEEKKEISFGEKTKRAEDKEYNYSKQIKDVEAQLAKENETFSNYFKGVLLFKEYVA